ncbi:putative glycosyl hydrolase or carbohydrate binding protein [Sphingobacterium paludis]|uniref:Putative glycosyl hydrolase or carbohydrate binding protein n=2 Tax=Sphingobacterium paludis TaxID=1476465 RepID=A0A4R7D307_9SPHI|nr:putative glycosyl hydrolase or carbohydrate binding protein [Sphingobacterium paludis]
MIAGLCFAIGLQQGCIKDAPPNPEADIESVQVESSQLTGNVFIDQINRTITLNLTAEAFQQGISPVLKLSEGASVKPESGTAIRFDGTAGATYTVTSASGKNIKVYTVKVVNVGNWGFDFENWQSHPTDAYEFPIESDNVQIWSSGNPGVALSGIPARRDAYPTRSTTDGYLGSSAAELITIKGTTLSEFVGIRLFAGSLFLGDFNASQALLNPLAATEFGQPYIGLPDRFTGYYKYTAGADYQNREGVVQPAVKDKCAIYAVLFNGTERLNATNVMTSDKVIARAELSDGSDKANFTRFDVPFVYKQGVNISDHVMVAIVASSSADGNEYRGAIGSRLVVDSLRVIPKL